MKGYGVACCTALVLLLALFLGTVVYSLYRTKPARRSPPSSHVHAQGSASTCRIRFVNIQHLPIPYFLSTRKKAAALHGKGLFADVDVVFMQEAFSRILLDKTDILTEWANMNASLQLTCAETALPSGYFTDSGLAAAGCAPREWSVRYVAFQNFSTGEPPCSFAYKGVAVFEVFNAKHSFRVANTHLQAVSEGNAIQLQQFTEALTFAIEQGALIIGGDFNVHGSADLHAMTNLVQTLTHGQGAYVPHDNQPTCCKQKSDAFAYTTASRLDHVWILNTVAVQSKHVITRDDLTDGISDHACLETTFYLDTAARGK